MRGNGRTTVLSALALLVACVAPVSAQLGHRPTRMRAHAAGETVTGACHCARRSSVAIQRRAERVVVRAAATSRR